MSQLVEELKIEHKIIVKALEEVKKAGIWNKEGQEKLMAVKYQLLSHLDKEDREMYPKLTRAAKENLELKQILEFYATNMNEITKSALAFFTKYTHGGSGYEFGNDFGKLYATLSLRIAKEETVLYRIFDELSDE